LSAVVVCCFWVGAVLAQRPEGGGHDSGPIQGSGLEKPGLEHPGSAARDGSKRLFKKGYRKAGLWERQKGGPAGLRKESLCYLSVMSKQKTVHEKVAVLFQEQLSGTSSPALCRGSPIQTCEKMKRMAIVMTKANAAMVTGRWIACQIHTTCATTAHIRNIHVRS
jgi:hypothetical protein